MPRSKESFSSRWEDLLHGVSFELGDEEVFDIPDARARARALRQYFFPKLNVLLNSGRSLISTIYGNDALQNFTEAQRPKPKDGAETDEIHDIHLGLVGVRVESGLAVRGSNGKPVQYGISHLWFEVFRRGTIAVTFHPIIYGKDPRFDNHVSKTLGEYEEYFYSVCGATFVTSAALLELATISETLEAEHLRRGAFFSKGADFPVDRESDLRRLVATFAALFPFQKLVTDLSMKIEPTIEADRDAFAAWWENYGPGIFAPEHFGVERTDTDARTSRVDWESDSRVLITGSRRFRIFDRDDYKCLMCGRRPEPDGVTLHIDHIKPRSKGGTDDDDNLQTLCSDCNIAKSNKSTRDLRTQ